MASEANGSNSAIQVALGALDTENTAHAIDGLEKLMLAQAVEMIRANPGARHHDRPSGKVEFRGQIFTVRVPRILMPDGKAVRVPLYEQLKPRGVDVAALRTAGVSTRGAAGVLAAASPDGASKGTSSSNVQRLQADVARERLNEINNRWLGDRHVVAVMIDGKAPDNAGLGEAGPQGIVVGKRTVLVAIGITVEGRKIVLGIAEDESENHQLVERLLTGLALDPVPVAARRW